MKKKKLIIIIISILLIITIGVLVLFKFVFSSGYIKKAFKNFSKLNSYSLKVSFNSVSSANMSITGVTNTIDYSGKYQHYTTSNIYKTDCYYDGERIIVVDVAGNNDQYTNYFYIDNPQGNFTYDGNEERRVCGQYFNNEINGIIEELAKYSYSKNKKIYSHDLNEEESNELVFLLSSDPFIVLDDHYLDKLKIARVSVSTNDSQIESIIFSVLFDEEDTETYDITFTFSNYNKLEDKLPDEIIENMKNQIAGDWVGTYSAITNCSQIQDGKYNNKLELTKDFDYYEGKSWSAKLGLCQGDVRTDSGSWTEGQSSYNYYVNNDEIIIFDAPFFDDEEDEIIARGKINGDKIDLVYDYEGKKIEITLTKEK